MRRSTRVLMVRAALLSSLLALATGAPAAMGALTGGPDVISPPASVVNSSAAGGATNDHQQGFDEQQGVLLEEDLAVDGGTIPAGTVVDSHMIFLNVPDGAPGATDFNRTWTFDGSVLGVMSDQNGTLEVASSSLLGASDTVYPTSPFASRGMEPAANSPARGAGGVTSEGYTVTGSSITIGMTVTQPGDWIRVITRTPACTGVTASPDTLWPPNHKLRTVSLTGLEDIEITAVTQDEPVDSDEDGDTGPDAVAALASDQVQLRAERSGVGDGRVYKIAFTAQDEDGTCAGTVAISVPLDQVGPAAVDSSPPSYDSFGS